MCLFTSLPCWDTVLATCDLIFLEGTHCTCMGTAYSALWKKCDQTTQHTTCTLYPYYSVYIVFHTVHVHCTRPAVCAACVSVCAACVHVHDMWCPHYSSCALGDCLTSRPEGHPLPGELWFSTVHSQGFIQDSWLRGRTSM